MNVRVMVLPSRVSAPGFSWAGICQDCFSGSEKR
jgi:hypothetical protein